MKRIALVGSSGGHLYVLGGSDPKALLGEVVKQVEAAGMQLGRVAFVAAKASLDRANDQTPAGLWVQTDLGPAETFTGTLSEVNQRALEENNRIAEEIENGAIDGLIVVSGDPKRINNRPIQAAAEQRIPVVGTGGTAMSEAQSMGANVVSFSGTTGTTNRTRAIGYISALASEWDLKYRPVIGDVAAGAAPGDLRSRINLRSIMMASLPGFIAMAVILAISRIPQLSETVEPAFTVLIGALPIIVAAVAAKQVSGLEEIGIVSGVVAGALSVEAGIIGGIIGGIIAGVLASTILGWAYRQRIPSTTASLLAGGAAGLTGGLLVYFLLAPVALFIGESIRGAIDAALAFNPMIAGAIAGLLIWPAIMAGVYHAAILPIVLIEMEAVGYSFLGAVDMAGLVMVSAGITLANIIAPRTRGERAVAAPGFLVNVGFGTFVEAAYPFMFSDKAIFGTAHFSAMLAGAVAGIFDARGIAYVPAVVAPGLSNNPLGFLLSMLTALVSACLLTIFFNKLAQRRAMREAAVEE